MVDWVGQIIKISFELVEVNIVVIRIVHLLTLLTVKSVDRGVPHPSGKSFILSGCKVIQLTVLGQSIMVEECDAGKLVMIKSFDMGNLSLGEVQYIRYDVVV